MISENPLNISKESSDNKQRSIKCAVWDLDNTLWHGVLLEDEQVELRESAVDLVRTLDNRGILQSVASRNDYDAVMEKLKDFGLDKYFLYPQVGWNSKSSYIENIAQSLNISVNTFAFIDDQPFEREEVSDSFPGVLCIDASRIDSIPEMPEFNPRFITEDSKLRRQLYLSDMSRNREEESFTGPKEEFLASLDMKLRIFKAGEDDLYRAEELTVRTNQLNATGYTYSYDELDVFRCSDDYLLLMAKLDDKFGTYGHIGLALIEKGQDIWTIKLLLMSCRVMSRGVGSIMLNYIMQLACREKICLRAEFMPNGRNRMMEITYGFAGFESVTEDRGLMILENSLEQVQSFPGYVEVITDE